MKVTLVSRTVRLVHREAEGALLSLQLRLAQAALAMPQRTSPDSSEPVCSPRQIRLAIREEL